METNIKKSFETNFKANSESTISMKAAKSEKTMDTNKTIAIGDIHGCFKELQKLIEMAEVNFQKDRLIFTGDYIDRGPDSYKVLEYLFELQSKYGKENIVLLRGNHEQMLLDYLSNNQTGWLMNGAEETINSFRKNKKDISDIVDLISSLPLYFEDEDFIYVHAGLRPGKLLKDQSEEDMLWIREEFYKSSYRIGKKVIFGHTPTIYMGKSFQPVWNNDKLAIDTGCVYGGWLSAVEIVDGSISKIFQVKSDRARICKCA